jgi:hypothetical protein
MLEKTEKAITNGQSRNICSSVHRKQTRNTNPPKKKNKGIKYIKLAVFQVLYIIK